MKLKERIKQSLLCHLHAVVRQRFELADNALSRGVGEFASFDYAKFRNGILAYLESVRRGDYQFLFSRSRTIPVLYGSIYAIMLKGLLKTLDKEPRTFLVGWGEYLNGFQRGDGYFYDDSLSGEAFEHAGPWHEGWGKKHLLGHMIIALARLGAVPKYEFAFLKPFYDADYLVKWMNGFSLDSDVWTDSNYFMNLYSVMQYARDWMNDGKAGNAVSIMEQWLLDKQCADTGMWHAKRPSEMTILEKLFVVRGAYHFYPLFEFDKIEVPHRDRVVDFILPLQNRWGAFAPEESRSGACEEIDALEPLIRFSRDLNYRTEEVRAAVIRSLIWCLSSRCSDGGFSFYPGAGQAYGGHPLTTNLPGESSLFATWFRTLTLAYQLRFLGIGHSFDIGRYPGYEIS